MYNILYTATASLSSANNVKLYGGKQLQVWMGNGRHLLLFLHNYTGRALASVLVIAVILWTLVLI